MPTATELSDEAPVTRIAPEEIAKQRNDPPALEPQGDEPIPPSTAFNTMAAKLDALMKEATAKQTPEAPRTTAPDPTIVQTDSRKPPTTPAAAPTTPVQASKEQNPTPTPPVAPTTPETITSPKAADWKAVKERKEAAEREAADFKAKYDAALKDLTELKAKPSLDPAMLEAIKKENETFHAERDRLQEQLNTVALERSEKFSSYFDKKFNQSLTQAKGAVGEEHEKAIEELISLPPSKARKERINEIREELSGIDQGALDQALANYDLARADKAEQLKNAKENYKKLVELEAEKHVAAMQDQEKRAELATINVLNVAKAGMESFKPSEDPDHNVFVAESEEFVKRFFKNKLSETEVALLPVLAREAQRYSAKVVPALQAKITELEAALAEYKGGTPRTGAAGPPPQAKTGAPKTFTETFLEQWPAGNR